MAGLFSSAWPRHHQRKLRRPLDQLTLEGYYVAIGGRRRSPHWTPLGQCKSNRLSPSVQDSL